MQPVKFHFAPLGKLGVRRFFRRLPMDTGYDHDLLAAVNFEGNDIIAEGIPIRESENTIYK